MGEKWVIVCRLLICVCELFNGRKMRSYLCFSTTSTVCQTPESHGVHLTTNAMYQAPMNVTRVWPNSINHKPSQLCRYVVILMLSFHYTNVLTEIQMVSLHNSFLLSRYIYKQNQYVKGSFIKYGGTLRHKKQKYFKRRNRGSQSQLHLCCDL